MNNPDLSELRSLQRAVESEDTFTCPLCGDTFDTDPERYAQAVAEYEHEQGKPIGDETVHTICENCWPDVKAWLDETKPPRTFADRKDTTGRTPR